MFWRRAGAQSVEIEYTRNFLRQALYFHFSRQHLNKDAVFDTAKRHTLFYTGRKLQINAAHHKQTCTLGVDATNLMHYCSTQPMQFAADKEPR
ncbi:hypothetical protein [Aromatoleum petrolei]|uniref:Transposase n=1 Tax=Aromatoleum petrolei TaxID=76116 RepID=A0ABX1MTA2_9RHOO|nr:hypothetical protein [Aromatoleum petrolei]NMF90460.1 hypothetical protein [Aromatoleum petrolei]